MIDYNEIAKKLSKSIENFTFEIPIEEAKSKMELREIPKEKLEKLGESGIRDNFIKGSFKIKLSEDKFVDFKALNEHCKKNNIKEPVLFLNPQFKYVQWEFTENIAEPQLKKHIKSQLKNNNEIDYDELQRNLLNESLRNKEIDGFISNIPLKISKDIPQGKMYLQASCSSKSAYKLIKETIFEVCKEREEYIKKNIKKDIRNSCLYFSFILVIITIWVVNEQKILVSTWMSTSSAIFLFVVPLVVLRLINHSFINSLFFRQKAKKKYKTEFNKLVD